jgi:hypothetical protein
MKPYHKLALDTSGMDMSTTSMEQWQKTQNDAKPKGGS